MTLFVDDSLEIANTAWHSTTHLCFDARQFESMNQTYSTAIGTHMARPAISTSPSQVKQWWRSMCAWPHDAEWRDNMQQYRWRALASTDAHVECYLTREMAFLKAQPLAVCMAF
jgi:hypothetical protein